MRNWLIRKLGGVTLAQYDRLLDVYIRHSNEWEEAVTLHEMEHAWAQIKERRGGGRTH